MSFPPREGNFITPLIDGEEAFARITQAIQRAQHSIWITVSFLDWRLPLPGTNGKTLLQLLSCMGKQNPNLDIKLLFYQCNNSFFNPKHVFCAPEHHQLLARYRPHFQCRWDPSPSNAKGHCHHEKSWLFDTGYPSEIVITGGMVVNYSTVYSTQGHDGVLTLSPSQNYRGHEFHDVDIEMHGPCCVDVAHSFVQRWNGAKALGGTDYPLGCTRDMPYPTHVSCTQALRASNKLVRAQVLRDIMPNLYRERGSLDYPIEQGEEGILTWYRQAFASAQKGIYIENQHFGHEELLLSLLAALDRGVPVVFVAPYICMAPVRHCRKQAVEWLRECKERDQARRGEPVAAPAPAPRYSRLFLEIFPRFLAYPHFALCGLTRPDREVYVHAKLAIVDDLQATVGSANLVDISLNRDHTELNIAFWANQAAPSRTVISTLRQKLMAEHMHDTARGNHELVGDDMRRDLLDMIELAKRNAGYVQRGEKEKMQGNCFALNPREYGNECLEATVWPTV